MDHTVRMLHDDDGHDPDVRVALPTLADLPDLAARFTASGTAVVQLDIDPEMTGTQPAVATPREVATTAYIVVREALTNVRRHAPTSSRVAVSIRRTTAGTRPGLLVTVTDDGSAPAPAPLGRRGGLGLPGLAARVQALGGTMTAGPDKPTGWRVVAVLPSTSNSG
jgi:signal transduction histidine kinase